MLDRARLSRLASAGLVAVAAVAAVLTAVASLVAGWWWGWVALRPWSSDPDVSDVDPSVLAAAEHSSVLAGTGAAVTLTCLCAGLAGYRISGRARPADRAGARSR